MIFSREIYTLSGYQIIFSVVLYIDVEKDILNQRVYQNRKGVFVR